MKVCLLVNPKAGTVERIKTIRRRLEKKHRLTVIETRGVEDLIGHAVKAAKSGFDVLAVAGGDGTLHAVINGLGPKFPSMPLVFIPLGTGNDFCRTLAVPLDPEFTTVLDHRVRARAIDVVRVQGGNSQFMLNAATGGFSGRVAADVTPELKQTWGPLAYLRGAAGPIASPVFYRLTIRYDHNPPESVTALNVVVANGRYAAGGLAVAPTANLEDGYLDVVVVRAGDFLDASAVAAALMAGDYLSDDNVSHRRVKSLEIVSDPPMPFSIDGELIVARQLTFEVTPRAVRVYPGRDYRPDPAGQPVGPVGLKKALFGLIAGGLRLVTRSVRWPAAGVTLAAVATALSIWLTLGVRAGKYADFNRNSGNAIQEYSDATPVWMSTVLTRLGDPGASLAVTVIVALLFVSWRKNREAVGLVTTLIAVGATESVVKPWLAIPRPDWVTPKLAAAGFGYPSGHALRAAGLCSYLVLLLVAGRARTIARWMLAACLVGLALGIAVSRVRLGVHSTTDVTAGLLIGTAVGSLIAVAVHPFRDA